MIRVNLALKKTADLLGTNKSVFSNIPDLSSLKELGLRKLLIPVVLALVLSFGLDYYKNMKLQELDAALAKINEERPKYETKIAQMQAFLELKKEIETEGEVVRIKKETIDKLIAGKTRTFEVLTSLADITPKEVWLNEVSINDQELHILGNATEFGLVSDFMDSLKATGNIDSPGLKNSEKQKDELGFDVINFEITGTEK